MTRSRARTIRIHSSRRLIWRVYRNRSEPPGHSNADIRDSRRNPFDALVYFGLEALDLSLAGSDFEICCILAGGGKMRRGWNEG